MSDPRDPRRPIDDRLDQALVALFRTPARRDMRARVAARLASAPPTPARRAPRWMLAAAAAGAMALILVILVGRRALTTVPTSDTIAVASPAAVPTAVPAGVAASPREDVPPGRTAPAPTPPVRPRPAVETSGAPIETDLAIVPLRAPTAIGIDPIPAESSAMPSLASDPLAIAPLDAGNGAAGQEERP